MKIKAWKVSKKKSTLTVLVLTFRWSGVILCRPERAATHQRCGPHERRQAARPAVLRRHTLHPAPLLSATLHWYVEHAHTHADTKGLHHSHLFYWLIIEILLFCMWVVSVFSLDDDDDDMIFLHFSRMRLALTCFITLRARERVFPVMMGTRTVFVVALLFPGP